MSSVQAPVVLHFFAEVHRVGGHADDRGAGAHDVHALHGHGRVHD